MTKMAAWGWRGGEDGGAVARIVSAHGDYYHLVCEEAEGEALARKKKSAFNAPGAVKPMTGDFVRYRYNAQGESMITAVLPRFSWFERRDPTARRKSQTLAVNFDTLFIMMPACEPVSRARLTRYLALAGDMGEAEAVVVLTKADLAGADEVRMNLEAVRSCGGGVEALAVSSRTGAGLEEVRRHVAPGRTVAFVGASGVGKSSLLNALAGEEWMATQEVQEWSGRGRHTTTSRELVMLPCGAMALDTPGIREIGMVGEVDDMQAKGEAGHRWRRGGVAPSAAVAAAAEPDWRVARLGTVGSTNEEAREGEPGDVYVAEEQTAGRGRLDHKWIASPGESLAMSAVIGVEGLDPTHVATLPLAAGLAVVEALEGAVEGAVEGGAARLALKWPNDVVALPAPGESGREASPPRKVAGILCERNGDCVIVGIGVNVAQASFPEEIAGRAASLAMLGANVTTEETLEAILDALRRVVHEWRRGGLQAVHARLAAVDFLKGRFVSVYRTDSDPVPVAGECGGIAPDGALVVDGERVWSGEAHVAASQPL